MADGICDADAISVLTAQAMVAAKIARIASGHTYRRSKRQRRRTTGAVSAS
jgi:hypothetical protein